MNLTPQILLSFDDELEKQGAAADMLRAAGGFLKSRGGTSAALGGAGAVLGGLAGGGISGIKNYRAAREAGATRGQAAMYGVQKGLGGASRGAMVGGALGVGAGLAAGGKGSQLAGLAEKITGKGVVGVPSRFAQRQLHSVTGYADSSKLKAMRAGTFDASERMGRAAKRLEEARKGGAQPGIVDKLKGLVGKGSSQKQLDFKAFEGAKREGQLAVKGLAAAEKAEKMGLTSLPGYAKSFVKNPLGTLAAGAGEQWHGSGAGGKGLMIGLPAAIAAGSMAPATVEGGPGRLERGAKALASGVAYAAAPLAGMAGLSLLNTSAMGAAGLMGAGGDVALKRRRKRRGGELPESQRGPESDDSNASHPEMYYSQAAMGKPPESVGS